MTAAAIVEEFRQRGVTLLADGEFLRCRPRSAPTAVDLELLKDHKPEILSYLSVAPVARLHCFWCKSTHLWRSIHGVVVCGCCHPPASPELVVEWIGPPSLTGDTR